MTQLEQLLADIKVLIEDQQNMQVADFHLRSLRATVDMLAADKASQGLSIAPIDTCPPYHTTVTKGSKKRGYLGRG